MPLSPAQLGQLQANQAATLIDAQKQQSLINTLVADGPPPPVTKSPWVPSGTQIPGGDPFKTWDFTQARTLPPEFAPSWFGDGNTQNGTKMLAKNVTMGPNGVQLAFQKATNTGGLISTNPKDGQHGTNPGFQIVPTVADPVFVQYAHKAMTAAEIANWLADWLTGQNWPATGEIDVWELFGGNPQCHLEFPNGSGGVSNPGITGLPNVQPGDHTTGVYWQPGMAEFFLDGKNLGTLKAPGYLASPLYIVVENSNGGGPDSVYTTSEIDVWNGPIVIAA